MTLTLAQMRAVHAGTLSIADAFAGGEPSGTMERDIGAEWNAMVPAMRASGNETIVALLEAHERCVEARADFTPCAKRARRRMLLDQWYIAKASCG